MSIDNLQSFRKLVGTSQELQAQIKASYAAGDVGEVIRLGARQGFEFTEEDLWAVFGSAMSNELSESQLEEVVGGAGGGASSLTHFERNVISSLPPSIKSDCGVVGAAKAPQV